MKKLYYFDKSNLSWNAAEYTNDIKLAFAFAAQSENEVPCYAFDVKDNSVEFYRGANGPTLSYFARLATDKTAYWHSQQFDDPIKAKEAWAKLVASNLARRYKLDAIEYEVKAGEPDYFEIDLPVPVINKQPEPEQTASANTESQTAQIAAELTPAVRPVVIADKRQVKVNKHTSVTRPKQMPKVKATHHSRKASQITEQPPWDTNDQQPNVLTAAEAQLAMATMSIPAQTMMQLAKSGQIEAPEMPKFDEKDLPPANYENFNYEDLADTDPVPTVKQSVKQPVKQAIVRPVAKPAVKKPVAVTTPDYNDAYDNYLPPYPTEEDDASWGML